MFKKIFLTKNQMTKSYFPYNSKNKTRDKIQYHVYLIPNILFTQTNNKFHQKK